MQEQVSISEGIPSFDFGEMWEGWQSHQQMVHPLLYPGGPIYAQALIHHIWMEGQGRETWELARRRELTPLLTMQQPNAVSLNTVCLYLGADIA